MSKRLPIRTGIRHGVVAVRMTVGLTLGMTVAMTPVAMEVGFGPSSTRPMVTPGPLSGAVATPPPASRPATVRTTPRVQPGPPPMRP